MQLTNLQQAARIRKWSAHIRDDKPTVMTTYNGDMFDFPSVAVRAMIHGIDVYTETGFKRGQSTRAVPHGLSPVSWLKRKLRGIG
jgi:DNA polymerase elongation subunit (family B)